MEQLSPCVTSTELSAATTEAHAPTALAPQHEKASAMRTTTKTNPLLTATRENLAQQQRSRADKTKHTHIYNNNIYVYIYI